MNIQIKGLELTFSLINATPLTAVQFRRIMYSRIPTVALNCLTINQAENKTTLDRGLIKSRIEFIPIYAANPSQFPDFRLCTAIYNDHNYRYRLDVSNTHNRVIQVTSADLKPINPNIQARPVSYNRIEHGLEPVYHDQGQLAVELFPLAPGERIALEIYAMLGTGRGRYPILDSAGREVRNEMGKKKYNEYDGSKWFPVSSIGYKMKGATFDFTVDLIGNMPASQLLSTAIKIYNQRIQIRTQKIRNLIQANQQRNETNSQNLLQINKQIKILRANQATMSLNDFTNQLKILSDQKQRLEDERSFVVFNDEDLSNQLEAIDNMKLISQVQYA